MTDHAEGFAPKDVRMLLRIEGLAALAFAVAGYQATGGNWWIFALLLLAPDLSMLGFFAGRSTGARVYNLAHTYTVPALFGGIGWMTGTGWLVAAALIWVAHIGMDRMLGYGLKYPDREHATHLGWIGKMKRGGGSVADAG